jgi:hypothetical protein
VWRRERGGVAGKVPGPFTRESLRERAIEEFEAATRRRRRVLFGFDHQWSWPRDLWRAAGLSHLPWRPALAALVAGDAGRPRLGPARVFAAAFNAFAREAVFYSRIRRVARSYGVPTAASWWGNAVRRTEVAAGAKPANRLGGPDSVGGQTLCGLRELHLLLQEARARRLPVLAWPFDALEDDGTSHVGVEIFPGLVRSPQVPKSDDADARACCDFAATADLSHWMDLRRAPLAVRRAARLEGWILGADWR